ncbi:nuclear transport factor 2 family protein [Spirosoma radiotolerans]|uniref:DUF4440 domain-containing protein n=1 Tax=Spirosoma radiotolerans TaxID=1379870 RepID=A0A0E3VAK4_9BACT|nr:nuclear transport factor 2 family protein [Spirosoma radiotolerans]AKD58231.1 hypothetical protein SD10_28395 [Spirosoma radiotolerans]
MNYVFSSLIALLFTTTAFAQQAAASQDPTALGHAFFKALLDEDSKTVESLISSDLEVISFDGQSIDGDLLVQGVSGGAFIIETGDVSDEVTRVYNNDSAVMTGTWKSKGNIQGQAFDNSVTFSVVIAKQAGIWKIVNVQFTPAR